MSAEEIPDGGWTVDDHGWQLDPSQKDRVRKVNEAAMTRIDAYHAQLPKCALCWQHVTGLDRFGLCSKVSPAHKAWRAGVRAGEKARAARGDGDVQQRTRAPRPDPPARFGDGSSDA